MLNILLTGIGGQGTVLAAKILAQAAHNKSWQVRTAETIGMAQRGGSVVSHIRIGNLGDEVFEPLIPLGNAQLVIAFEPAEAVRVLPYLAEEGMLVCAQSGVQPVATTRASTSYHPYDMLSYLREVVCNFISVDNETLCTELGSHKALNTILLARALQELTEGHKGSNTLSNTFLSLAENDDVSSQKGDRKAYPSYHLQDKNESPPLCHLHISDLKEAIRNTVKPQFIDLNLRAIDLVTSYYKGRTCS